MRKFGAVACGQPFFIDHTSQIGDTSASESVRKRVLEPEQIEGGIAMSTKITLGLPGFGFDFMHSNWWAPLGQETLYRNVKRPTLASSQSEIQDAVRGLIFEYVAILEALHSASIDFQILIAHEEVIPNPIQAAIVKFGLHVLPIPDIDIGNLTYPRDLALVLPNGKVLVDDELRLPFALPEGAGIVPSMYGQGGRVHTRNDVALVCEQAVDNVNRAAPGVIATRACDIGPLKEAGLRIGMLPLQVTREEAVNRKRGYGIHDHPDRTSGLLEDPHGDLHLVVDPVLWSGYRGISKEPRNNPTQTLRRYRAVSEQLGITMHVPSALTVPMAVGFVQFENGQVLMTSGDSAVYGIVSSIVGRENVTLTRIPIKHYPVLCRAGIHCLVTELPSVFNRLSLREAVAV